MLSGPLVWSVGWFKPLHITANQTSLLSAPQTHPSCQLELRVVFGSSSFDCVRQLSHKSVQIDHAPPNPPSHSTGPTTPIPETVLESSIMAPKKNAAATAPAETPVSTPAKATKAAKAQASKSSLLPEQIWSHYWKTTGHQTRLIDAFLAFLMAVGAIQFVYYFLIAKDVRATPSDPGPCGTSNE